MRNINEGPVSYRPFTWDVNIWNSVVHGNEYGFSPNDPRMPWKGDVVDIGGHIGGFSWLAIHRLNARHIVTLEPDPENFKHLSANLQEYIDTGRIEAINKGIGTPEKFLAPMSNAQENTGGNLFFNADEGKITTITLDELLAKVEGPVMLKIDCEGCEYQAVLDCTDFSKVNCVVGEYHHNLNNNVNILAKFFREQNFAFSTSRKGDSIGMFGAHRLH